MILGFALAYIFGIMRAGLGALLGEFAAPVALASALLPLSEVLLPSVVLVPVLMLRLLLYLGPVAVSSAQNYWWLSLPVEHRELRRAAQRRAGLIGGVGTLSMWLLWYALTASVLSSGSWLMLVVGSLTAVVAGLALTDLALIVQHRGTSRGAGRLLKITTALLAVWCIGQWAVRAIGWIAPTQELLAQWFWSPATFFGVLIFTVLARICLWFTARETAQRIQPKVLRAAGERQRAVHAALFVMDAEALTTIAKPRFIKRRGFFGQLNYLVLPVSLEIITKRVSRRGSHYQLLLSLLLCAGLLLLVSDAANPVSLSIMMLVVLTQLMLIMSAGVESLLGGGSWHRILGFGRWQMPAGLLGAVLLPGLVISSLTAVSGLLLFDMAHLWQLLPAVLLTSLGTVAGVGQRAGRAQMEMGASLQQIGTTTGALSTTSYLISGILPLLVAAVPLLVVLLTASVVHWLLWAVAVIAAWSGIKMLIPDQ